MSGAAARLVLVGLLAASAARAAESTPGLGPERVKEIEAAVKSAMTEGQIPGLSLLVVADGQPRFAKAFGVADVENTVSAQTGTVYRLGSLSKPVTAVAVMRLAEQDKLDLDAPIQTYCPAYPAKPWPLTARELLAHLGGVRDYDRNNFLGEYLSTRHYDGVTESLEIFKNDPLLYEPGTKYAYSTYGYVLLGCAIEGASGTSYENYVREAILKPAGMTHTGIDDVLAIVPNRARGYGKTRAGAWRNAALVDTSNKIPAGGLVSTVEDMGRFWIALASGVLVRPATLEAMWTPQKTREGTAVPYGLGWRVGDHGGQKEVFHGGAASGFSTFLYALPERKIAVAIMANMELLGEKQRDDLARHVADVVGP